MLLISIWSSSAPANIETSCVILFIKNGSTVIRSFPPRVEITRVPSSSSGTATTSALFSPKTTILFISASSLKADESRDKSRGEPSLTATKVSPKMPVDTPAVSGTERERRPNSSRSSSVNWASKVLNSAISSAANNTPPTKASSTLVGRKISLRKLNTLRTKAPAATAAVTGPPVTNAIPLIAINARLAVSPASPIPSEKVKAEARF